jgi:predicted ferric reductase
MYRIIRSRRQTEIIKVLLHPSGAMEVRFKKDSMKYKAGQWLFLNCPEVSRYQWHPVSSAGVMVRREAYGSLRSLQLRKIHSSRSTFVKLGTSQKL